MEDADVIRQTRLRVDRSGDMVVTATDNPSRFITVRCTNINPDNPGGQHTNGPPTFWWSEGGDGWRRSFSSSTFRVSDMRLLLSSGMSIMAIGAVLYAGGAR